MRVKLLEKNEYLPDGDDFHFQKIISKEKNIDNSKINEPPNIIKTDLNSQ